MTEWPVSEQSCSSAPTTPPGLQPGTRGTGKDREALGPRTHGVGLWAGSGLSPEKGASGLARKDEEGGGSLLKPVFSPKTHILLAVSVPLGLFSARGAVLCLEHACPPFSPLIFLSKFQYKLSASHTHNDKYYEEELE